MDSTTSNIKKKRKRSLSKTKKLNNNSASLSQTELKKNKISNEKVSNTDFTELLKSKKQFEKVMENYVMEDENIEKTQSRTKVNQKLISKLKKVKARKEKSLPAKDPSAEIRTIFVGNVNITCDREMVKKYFLKYGEVETVRFRGITPESLNVTKKEAVVKKLFNPHRKSLNAYVRFKEEASVEKALEANGTVFEDFHIHVDRTTLTVNKDVNSVFVGNLPWEINEEDLWQFFTSCGDVTNVRVVRSSVTGAGKGFGFVSFKTADGVEMALHLDGKTLMNRQLRVKKMTKKGKDKALKIDRKHGVKKKKNVMNVSFLKNDKPQIRVKESKEKNRKRKPRLNDLVVGTKPGNFSGTKAVKDGKVFKKAKKRSRAEKKKNSIAKILGYA